MALKGQTRLEIRCIPSWTNSQKSETILPRPELLIGVTDYFPLAVMLQSIFLN
jgi:hypothetical protein